MKITDETYTKLLNAIRPLADKLKAHENAIISSGKMPKNMAVRVRWDAFWSVKGYEMIPQSEKKELKDNHIDTALRSIMKEIGQEEYAK